MDKVIIPPEQEGEIRKDAKMKERKRMRGVMTVVQGEMTPAEWEYVSLRVSGLAAEGAVIKIAQDTGEEITRKQVQKRAEAWEARFAGQIQAHQRDRYMSDADFDAWARLKVEQIAANPTAYAQSALRAIMVLKKMREETRARNPEALLRQLDESAEQLGRLDRVEAEGRRRGLISGEGG